MSKGKYLKKQKASLGKKILRVVLVILLILVILIGAVVAFVWSKLGLITYDDGSLKETYSAVDTAPVDTAPVDETTDATGMIDVSEPVDATEDPAADATAATEDQGVSMDGLTMVDAPEYSDGELFKDSSVMNILLVGTDEHTEGFVTNARGDVNILVSIDKDEKTVKLVSFSRGIAMKMLDGPYKGQYEWLTNCHRWAGTEAVLQAIEESFKIECDRYVRVNFNSVAEIVDAIGGIEMELTKTEVNFMKNMNSWRIQDNLVEGVNLLDGQTACYYARLRGVDDDWNRMQRQRRCILAVIDKLKGSDFSTLNDLCDMVLPLIQTNLTKLEIAELILYSPKFLVSEFDQMTIPLENSYGGMTVMSGSGGWALNYEKNNAALHEFLYGAE